MQWPLAKAMPFMRRMFGELGPRPLLAGLIPADPHSPDIAMSTFGATPTVNQDEPTAIGWLKHRLSPPAETLSGGTRFAHTPPHIMSSLSEPLRCGLRCLLLVAALVANVPTLPAATDPFA